MTAKWLWGSVSIYVSDFDDSEELKIAELQKLDAIVSTFHFFGAASTKYHIKGMVIGDANKALIKADAVNNTTRTLTTPWGTHTVMFINGSPKFSAIKYAGGTIDGTFYSAESTPLYDCEIEVTS